MLVKNRRGRTEQVRIASEKMLFPVDNNWPFFDDAGANSVSTLEPLAPDRTCPKTRGLKCRIVRDRPSPIDHKPAAIRQQNRTADLPTARNSRSSVLWATLSNCPRRSCAPTSSAWVSRREGARFVGSSACKWPERRHEAASPEFALLPPARTSRTVLAWTALSERPMSPPSPNDAAKGEVPRGRRHIISC